MNFLTDSIKTTDILLAEAYLHRIPIISPETVKEAWGLRNTHAYFPCFFDKKDIEEVIISRARYSFEPVIIYLSGMSLEKQKTALNFNRDKQNKNYFFFYSSWWQNPLMKDFFEESFPEGYYLIYNLRGVSPLIREEKIPIGFEAASANMAAEIFLTISMLQKHDFDLPGEYPFNWRHHGEMFESFYSFVGPLNGNGLKIDFKQKTPEIISTERWLLLKKEK